MTFIHLPYQDNLAYKEVDRTMLTRIQGLKYTYSERKQLQGILCKVWDFVFLPSGLRFLSGLWLRCKIRLRDIYSQRSAPIIVSCISDEARQRIVSKKRK